jgi:hypothetical protein
MISWEAEVVKVANAFCRSSSSGAQRHSQMEAISVTNNMPVFYSREAKMSGFPPGLFLIPLNGKNKTDFLP